MIVSCTFIAQLSVHKMLRNLKPHTRREWQDNSTASTASLWTSLLFSDYCEMPRGDQPRIFSGQNTWKWTKSCGRLASKGPFKYAGATFDKLYIWVTPERGSISNRWQLKTKWCSSLVPPPAYLNLSPPQAMLSCAPPFEHKWLDNDLPQFLYRILKANKSLVYPMAKAGSFSPFWNSSCLNVTHSWAFD